MDLLNWKVYRNGQLIYRTPSPSMPSNPAQGSKFYFEASQSIFSVGDQISLTSPVDIPSYSCQVTGIPSISEKPGMVQVQATILSGSLAGLK